MRVDNAMRLNNNDVSGILQKGDAIRTPDEKEKLDSFTTNLESQVCLKKK